MFSSFLEDIEKNFFNPMEETRGDIPAVNIIDDKDSFIMELAAPGMKKDDFKINLDNQLLTISSEKKEEKEKQEDNYTRREFTYNSFSRSFTLPKTIVFDKIKADYKDGILVVKLPKKEEEAKLTREIKVA
ncbi:MAG: Hsp20/alpha crystallin family protein [Bacteroidales bacterium]|nr:Hsp20/alpha crystallin family protein [Bacteroidales bacterium]